MSSTHPAEASFRAGVEAYESGQRRDQAEALSAQQEDPEAFMDGFSEAADRDT